MRQNQLAGLLRCDEYSQMVSKNETDGGNVSDCVSSGQ